MPTDSANHDLTRNDPADGPPCPMERLSDRFCDAPKPEWLLRDACREYDGSCHFTLEGWITDRDEIEDLINYLSRVRG